MKNYFPKNLLKKSKENTEKQAGDNNVKDFIRTGLFSLSFVLLMTAAIYLLQNTITVTSSPNGKELPIYCVDRDDNKVALSFDAAWGNEDTQKLLDILASHNLHVTFFMTGGWVAP